MVLHVKRSRTERLPQVLIWAVLQLFVCEFLVTGSWRGDYSYSHNLISDLGVPYCGSQGTEPCSTSWALMNGSIVLVGVALLVAAVWVRRPSQPRAGTVFLAASGIGAVVVGLVPSNSSWPFHALGASLFFLFGGCFAITIGLSIPVARPTKGSFASLTYPVAPWLATLFGFIAVAGYFCYTNSWDLGLGPGGMERVSAYAVVLGFISIMLREKRTRRAIRNVEAVPAVARHRAVITKKDRGYALIGMFATLALGGTTVGCSTVHADVIVDGSTMFDDFNGDTGSAPSSRVWSYDLGGGGWGNAEVQTYTDSPDNVRPDGGGRLEINALRGHDGGFTSTRLTTRGKFAFTNGRAEARIKVPAGDGVHPAFWLLGSDIDGVGWPRAGEIDVIETINDAAAYNCTVHGPKADGGDWQEGNGGAWPAPLSADFHTYWVQRAPGSITMGIDDTTTCSLTAANVGAQNIWVFDKPFFLLLNVAVGGKYPGPTSARTPSPATMLVDWVRVTPS
jgi:beta-glucanase (GH16 family)/hypothetical membrane protein